MVVPLGRVRGGLSAGALREQGMKRGTSPFPISLMYVFHYVHDNYPVKSWKPAPSKM